MKAKLLTFVTLAAMFVGGLVWTNTADARPWRGYYAGPPARFYSGPGYAYPYRAYSYGYAGPYRNYGWNGPAYYGPRLYGPRVYRAGFYGPRYYPGYYSSGVYLGAGPVGVYAR